jgi:hypothetical protein
MVAQVARQAGGSRVVVAGPVHHRCGTAGRYRNHRIERTTAMWWEPAAAWRHRVVVLSDSPPRRVTGPGVGAPASVRLCPVGCDLLLLEREILGGQRTGQSCRRDDGPFLPPLIARVRTGMLRPVAVRPARPPR